MAEIMRVRARDFFVLDEDATTIDINGGYLPVYLLNEGMLDDVRSDSPPLLSDASAAERLLDLEHDEFVGYGTSGTTS